VTLSMRERGVHTGLLSARAGEIMAPASRGMRLGTQPSTLCAGRHTALPLGYLVDMAQILRISPGEKTVVVQCTEVRRVTLARLP
jgi:hypothetical protein